MFPVFLVVPYECVKKNRICRTSFLCWRVSQLKCLKILVSCRVIRISRELRFFKVDSGFFLEGVLEGLGKPSQSVSHYQDKIGERPPRDLSHGVRIVGVGSELLG
jgi:hypothetical protein